MNNIASTKKRVYNSIEIESKMLKKQLRHKNHKKKKFRNLTKLIIPLRCEKIPRNKLYNFKRKTLIHYEKDSEYLAIINRGKSIIGFCRSYLERYKFREHERIFSNNSTYKPLFEKSSLVRYTYLRQKFLLNIN